jgi:hypothetical protein
MIVTVFDVGDKLHDVRMSEFLVKLEFLLKAVFVIFFGFFVKDFHGIESLVICGLRPEDMRSASSSEFSQHNEVLDIAINTASDMGGGLFCM